MPKLVSHVSKMVNFVNALHIKTVDGIKLFKLI